MTETTMTEEVLEPDLSICDPHHHLWDFPTSRYLLPELLADLGQGHRVESTVYMECGAFYNAHATKALAPVGETEFVTGVAAMADSGRYGAVRACAGIVGFADLTLGVGVDEVLAAHVRAGGGRFRGIRHAASWHASDQIRNGHTNPPEGLYGREDFRQGFGRLAAHGLSFDAWQYHTQLSDVISLARAFPETAIMLNHVGGPLGIGPYAGRGDEVFADWSRGIRELATCANVWVKLGGLGMAITGLGFNKRPATSVEIADAWRPYLETCIEAFGVGRGLFESNYPVDGVSCSYGILWNAFKRVAVGAPADEKARLFRDNALEFYRLDLGV